MRKLISCSKCNCNNSLCANLCLNKCLSFKIVLPGGIKTCKDGDDTDCEILLNLDNSWVITPINDKIIGIDIELYDEFGRAMIKNISYTKQKGKKIYKRKFLKKKKLKKSSKISLIKIELKDYFLNYSGMMRIEEKQWDKTGLASHLVFQDKFKIKK